MFLYKSGPKRRRSRRNLVWPLAALLVVSVVLKLADQANSPQIGSWQSVEGQAAYVQAYQQTMQALPQPRVSRLISTRFGQVQTYVFGHDLDPQQAPLLLIPGRASGVPMWRENLPDLISARSVIAFDALGDAGLSEQMRPIRNDADQAAYIAEVLDALQVEQAHVIGHSFGGWSAANFARFYPDRVASLSLLEPVFVVQGLKPEMWIKISAMLLFRSVPLLGEQLSNRVSQDIGGSEEPEDLNDPMARMIGFGMRYYSNALPLPGQWTSEQLSQLKMPVFVALGEKSALHDAEAGAAVARAALPNAQVKIWPQGTHSLPMQFPEEIDHEILSFISAMD